MSEKATLEQKLNRLTASGVAAGGARALTGPPETLLHLILREIDDIVLPRVLHLDIAGGRNVSCEVTSRRLLRVLGKVGGAAGKLDGTALAADDAETVAKLRAYLEAAIGKSTAVAATHKMLERSVEPGEMGISALALAEAWGMPLDGGASRDARAVVEDLAAHAGDAVLAWHVEGGDAGGDPALIATLKELPLGPDGGLLASTPGPALSLVQRADGSVLVVGRQGATGFALAAQPAAKDALVARWRSLTS
ncbi:MAG: hypothetical protein AAFY77_04935 [Pseudomonadota bacterium]